MGFPSFLVGENIYGLNYINYHSHIRLPCIILEKMCSYPLFLAESMHLFGISSVAHIFLSLSHL
jgi:hypothetical protein